MDTLKQMFPQCEERILKEIYEKNFCNLEISVNEVINFNTENVDKELVAHISTKQEQENIMKTFKKTRKVTRESRETPKTNSFMRFFQRKSSRQTAYLQPLIDEGT